MRCAQGKSRSRPTRPEKCFIRWTTFPFGCAHQLSINRSSHILESNGLLFGVQFDGDYPMHEIPFSSGDRFLLYTDGFSEPENTVGEAFGDRQLEQVLRDGQSFSATLLLTCSGALSRVSRLKSCNLLTRPTQKYHRFAVGRTVGGKVNSAIS